MSNDNDNATPEEIARARLVYNLATELSKCLDGQPNDIVASVISYLTARHIAACHAGKPEATFIARTKLLEEHIDQVLWLILTHPEEPRAPRKSAN